jgi:hypothetical protein
VTAAVFWLVVWTADDPGGSGGWIAAGLRWAGMISACAALMMTVRSLTAGSGKPPAWLSRLRGNRLARGAVAGGTEMLGQ